MKTIKLLSFICQLMLMCSRQHSAFKIVKILKSKLFSIVLKIDRDLSEVIIHNHWPKVMHHYRHASFQLLQNLNKIFKKNQNGREIRNFIQRL